MDNNLNDGVINRFYFSTFSDFLAVSNAMVAHENGVWGEIDMPNDGTFKMKN
jgi:hypothetical protein